MRRGGESQAAGLPPDRQDRSHGSGPTIPQLPPGTRAACSKTHKDLQVAIFAIRNPDPSPL